MSLDAIPLFSMLKAKLGYDNRRQSLIAENVANSETPGFKPRDLNAFTFQAALQGSTNVVRTSAAHLSGHANASHSMSAQDTPDTETKLDGNQVVLEEQMIKMSDVRADFDAAISLYQQSMTMLRTAARKPGS